MCVLILQHIVPWCKSTVTEVLHLLLVDRGYITKQISLFFGARKWNQMEMFSFHAEMSLPIAAASDVLAACSTMTVWYQFVDVSVAQWGHHTMQINYSMPVRTWQVLVGDDVADDIVLHS